MSKRYEVTRTFEGMEVTALVCDTVTAELSNETFTIGHVINSEEKLEKLAAKKLNKGDVRFVKVVDSKVTTKVLGMTSEQFIANAVELDPKTRKPITE